MVLATPLAGGGEVTARQISLNPASSCPRNQLWCCDTVGIVRPDSALLNILADPC